MNSTIELHFKISKRIKTLRSIARLIESREFTEVYESLEDKTPILELIQAEDKQAIYKWIKRQHAAQTDQIRELRLAARDAGIREWYSLSPKELNAALKDIDRKSIVRVSGGPATPRPNEDSG